MAEITPAISSVIAQVTAQFGYPGDKGIYVCKYIKGTSTPSQHSWGNAVDLDVYGPVAQKPYVNFLAGLTEVAEILWADNRPADHYDHIHVTGNPKMTGTPPCMGGSSSGSVNQPITEDPEWWEFWKYSDPQKPFQNTLVESAWNTLSPDFGAIALRFLYASVGIAALAIGAVLIVNDFTGGRAVKVVKDIAPIPGPVKQVLPGG